MHYAILNKLLVDLQGMLLNCTLSWKSFWLVITTCSLDFIGIIVGKPSVSLQDAFYGGLKDCCAVSLGNEQLVELWRNRMSGVNRSRGVFVVVKKQKYPPKSALQKHRLFNINTLTCWGSASCKATPPTSFVNTEEKIELFMSGLH